MRPKAELRTVTGKGLDATLRQSAGWASSHHFRSDRFKSFGKTFVQRDSWADGKTTTDKGEAESLFASLANAYAQAALNALLRLIQRPGVLIDVGVHRTSDGLVGDVRFAEACEVAGAITPVPGGVGPMTTSMLLVNTVAAAEAQAFST